MSADAVAWVFRHSPLTGANLTVHLAIADSVNDQHGYELWMRVPTLASKARVHAGSVRRALAEMIEQGLLEELDDGRPSDDAGSATKPRRFLFLMPDDEPVRHESRPRRVREARAHGAGNPRTMREARAHGAGHLEQKVEPQDEPKVENPPTPRGQLALVHDEPPAAQPAISGGHDLAFDAFWQAYPRKAAKIDARKAWRQALRHAPDHVIVAGAQRYRDDPNRDDQYTKLPAGWLRDGMWDDPPLPPRAPQRGDGQTGGQRAIAGYLAQRAAGDPTRGVLHHPAPDPKGLPR